MYRAFSWILHKMYEYRRLEKCPSFTGMWFRGCENAEFSILPSGYVHFAEECGRIIGRCSVNGASYIDCQRHLYESFRYMADGYSEHQNHSFYTAVDHLALMQHYSQYSNLLDWSEDFNTAMYFALESEIIANGSYRKVVDGQKDSSVYRAPDKPAVIYFLDPIRFNLACIEMEKKLAYFAINQPESEKMGELIPNLSVIGDDEYYKEFSELYDTDQKSGRWLELTSDAEERTLLWWKSCDDNKIQSKLPRAVYVSKMNPRLRAQSGLFVAFSLHSPPAYKSEEDTIPQSSTDLFQYLAVEELQHLYVRELNGRPFLFKAIIPTIMKKEFGEQLNRLGFCKERFYPELENHRSR